MTQALQITPAEPQDAAAIAAIYAHHVLHGTASFETVPPTPDAIGARIAGVNAAGAPWLVARAPDAQVLGYAYAAAFGTRAAYRFTCEDSIYVRHDRRGGGIGAALLGRLIEAAGASGFRQMIALIAGTEPASAALHARLGFVPAGRLAAVGRKHGRWIDIVHMQRGLDAADTAPPRFEPE